METVKIACYNCHAMVSNENAVWVETPHYGATSEILICTQCQKQEFAYSLKK